MKKVLNLFIVFIFIFLLNINVKADEGGIVCQYSSSNNDVTYRFSYKSGGGYKDRSGKLNGTLPAYGSNKEHKISDDNREKPENMKSSDGWDISAKDYYIENKKCPAGVVVVYDGDFHVAVVNNLQEAESLAKSEYKKAKNIVVLNSSNSFSFNNSCTYSGANGAMYEFELDKASQATPNGYFTGTIGNKKYENVSEDLDKWKTDFKTSSGQKKSPYQLYLDTGKCPDYVYAYRNGSLLINASYKEIEGDDHFSKDILKHDYIKLTTDNSCEYWYTYFDEYTTALTEYANCDSNCSVASKNYTTAKEKIKKWCNNQTSTYNYNNECVKKCLTLSTEVANAEKELNKFTQSGECFMSANLTRFLKNLVRWVKYIIPVLLIILSIFDFIRAIANEDEGMKRAKKHLINRLIAIILIFTIPSFIEFFLDKFGFVSKECSILMIKLLK